MQPLILALTLTAGLTSTALAGNYSSPYPYHSKDPARGHQLYTLHGCTDYDLVAHRVKQVCDVKAPDVIFKRVDRDGHGVAVSAGDGK